MDDTYVPYHLYQEIYTGKDWTLVELNLSHLETAKQGVTIWCTENIQGRWTMKTTQIYMFEDGEDAVIFKFKFGLK